jgi:tRNA(Ile)-lysidine synthase
LPKRLAVRFRGGGERIRLRPDGPSRTLKELLRERGVLPWMRFQVPLLFAGDALVAAAQLFTAAAFAAQPDSRVRYRLEWRGAPLVLAADPVADRLPSTRV